MRKVIYQVAVSLDGYIEGPNGEFDWCFTAGDYGMADFLKGIDAFLYGRKSYELMLRMGEAFGADYQHYVFSNSLPDVADNVQLVREPAAGFVRELKQRSGKDIWLFGGAELAGSLLDAGLVDELQLAVHPVLLGAGRPMFLGQTHRVYLQLVEARPYPDGLVMMVYGHDPHSI